MHDFNCSNADDMYFELLAEKTRYLKENQEGVKEMCKAMEELWEEGFECGCAEGLERGLAQGHEQGLTEGHQKQAMATAKNLAQLGMPVEQIASAVNFSQAIVSEWLATGTVPESVSQH